MEIVVKRTYKGPKYTIGHLYIDGVYFCDTLEDPDRGLKDSMSLDQIKKIKIKGDTCIPYGKYNVAMNIISPKYSNLSKYPYASKANGKMPRIMNIKGFSGVLIHAGNTQKDTEGCLLVGYNKVKGKVVNSQNTWSILYDKMIAKDSDYSKYICSELEILKTLNHPNIVKLIKVIDDKSQMALFFVMEYCTGGTLSECFQKYQKKYQSGFPEEIIQHIMRQMVDALNYIHDRNIIHRDLKLDNIMVHFDNEKDRNELNMMKAKIKLAGFLLAKKLPIKMLLQTQ
jgi:serine/threonine protein kinase